jgi:hypothetical protein
MADNDTNQVEDHLGMSDEHWEIFQKATHGYGEQDENGIDISLLRENLKLTPTQRLERLAGALAFVSGFKKWKS